MERREFEDRYIKARRAAIGQDFMRLNEKQREAVLATRGPLLLLAGAGSGKTTALTSRITNLLRYGEGSDSDFVPDLATDDDLAFLEAYTAAGQEPSEDDRCRIRELCAVEPAEPWRVIAITFTNKAAGELRQRLTRMLGPGSEDIWAMTFHSACVRILRRDIDKLGYDRSFTIYDSSDSVSVMKRIIKELELDEKALPPKSALGHISRAKDGMISAEEFYAEAEKTFDVRKKMIGRAYLEYDKRLKSANALDFDDLILRTVQLFKQYPDTLGYYQQKFKYVLIDEYQDTNNLQYMLASALAGGYGNICVVGDDDQSIYKFRGATIENILSFEKRYKNARVIRLEQNYRSNGRILAAANDVIGNNKGRKGKTLWTENEQGESPALHVSADEREEAAFVAETILESLAAGKKWSDHAVLYRMNAQSNQLEYAFKRAGIPYKVFGGTGFYERMEVKDMLAYMCVVNNPADDLRLLRIVNNPPRGLGATTLGRLVDIAAERAVPVFDVMKESENYPDLQKSAGKLHQFTEMIGDLRALASSAPLDEFYDALIARTGYIRALQEKDTDENLNRIENVNELKTNILGFLNDSGGTLQDFLSEVALYTDLDRFDESADRAVMMTMHSAKGLEFDTVFIVGAEEGIFPGQRVIGEPDEMEEERRLCYVAMTRAERRLYFTSARRRMLFGKTTANMPSRFVREIGEDNIDAPALRDGFTEPAPSWDFDAPGGSGGSFGNRNGFSAGTDFDTPGRKPGAGISASGGRGAYAKKRGKPVYSAPSAAEPLPDYAVGDTVAHNAFGRGKIANMQPAGNDALIEVEFEASGIKRLMLRSAAKFMVKEKTADV